MKITSRPGRLLVSLLLLALSLAATAAERTVYFVNDAQGSPVAAMDQQGEVLWRESYAPYGERRTKAADNNGKPAYTGKPEDADTSLVYMHARMYDPETARFTGIDPQGFGEDAPQSFGRYLYANNSPYVYVDPDGELPVLIPLLYVAYRAYSASDTIDSAVTNIQVVADPNASTMDRALAGGELASSLVGGKAGRGAFSLAEKKVTEGAGDTVDVYRVFGGDARAQGFSWTTVDPRSVGDFRDAAGLPSGGESGATNTAEFLIKGTVNASDIIKSRSALPLDGNRGGLKELIINPKSVSVTDFSVLKP